MILNRVYDSIHVYQRLEFSQEHGVWSLSASCTPMLNIWSDFPPVLERHTCRIPIHNFAVITILFLSSESIEKLLISPSQGKGVAR